MELDKIPQWMLALEEEDAAFLKNFLMKSGSLKDIAKLYGVCLLYTSMTTTPAWWMSGRLMQPAAAPPAMAAPLRSRLQELP